MALVRPIIELIEHPFDATRAYDITFTTLGQGDQVVRNNFVIINNNTGLEVYNQNIESFELKHTIPSGTLVNGTEYYAKLRTGNVNNEWSEFSNYIYFKCFSPPIITITNINNGIVNNQTYTFTATYTQAENEVLQSYRYLLYNSNQILLQSFNEKFDNLLSQEITGFDNDENYYIEVKTNTVNNLEGSTGLISFKASFIQPKLMSVLSLENNSNDGTITASAEVIQVLGYIGSGSVSYESSDWINLLNGSVVFDEGFSFENDFTMKVWGKGLVTDKVFLKIKTPIGYYEFTYYDDKIHCFKHLYNGGIIPHYASNLLSFVSTDNIFIWVKQINGAIDLVVEKGVM